MEANPYLLELLDSRPPFRPESGPASQVGADPFDFEFPTAISGAGAKSAVANNIVFCGEVISRQTDPGPLQRRKSKNPFLLRSESFGRYNVFMASLRSPSAGEKRCRRSGSGSGSGRKHRNGLFGTLKFPLQMELSDIKMRQERREPLPLPRPLPKLPAEEDGRSVRGGGGESYWELVRPLRRRGPLMSALAKASLGCIPSC